MLSDIAAWLPALVLYLLLVYWILDARLFSKTGFTPREIAVVFSVKCAWCFAYAMFHWLFFHGGDTLVIFREATQVNRALYRDPVDFLVLEFLPNHWYIKESLHHYNHALHMYGSESTWLLVRLNALFNFVSFGSYPAHIVLFSFVTLFPMLCLLRFMMMQIRIHKAWIYVVVLLFPAVAFWCNGMHKEAMVTCGAGLVFYALMSVRDVGWSAGNGAMFFTGLILLLSRAYMPLLLAPAMVAIYFQGKRISAKTQMRTALVIGLVVVLAILRLTRNDFLTGLRSKQLAFLREADPDATVSSFTISDVSELLATGFYRGFVFPVPAVDSNDPKDWPIFLMNLLVLVLPLLTFRYIDKHRFFRIGIWFVAAAILYFIIVGAIVPYAGAISRYKAPMLLFLIFGWLTALRPFDLRKTKSE